MERAVVPCGSCRHCCQRDWIVLFPEHGDVIESYDCERVLSPAGWVVVLKHKPNGECIYLGPEGCTIHTRAPSLCQAFDCRRFYLMYSHAERRRMVSSGATSSEVFEAGRARLASLDQFSSTLPGSGLNPGAPDEPSSSG
jgi:Fe-S-cluster containining protein